MEAIILDFKKQTIKIKNIDTEKISYLNESKKGYRKGDILSIKVDKQNFSKGFLFISGEVKKLNSKEYIFDECLKCGSPFNNELHPLCKKCWHNLKDEKKSTSKGKQRERKFHKDTSVKIREKLHEDFRKKFPAEILARDGHWVRSRAEKMIDDFLYRNQIIHIYERKIPGENMFCDFYIPKVGGKEKIWVEYWGKNTVKYNIRRDEKIDIYKKLGYYPQLIEIDESDIGQIDESIEDKFKALGVIGDFE